MRCGNEWVSYCELRAVNDKELNIAKTAEYLLQKQWVSWCGWGWWVGLKVQW